MLLKFAYLNFSNRSVALNCFYLKKTILFNVRYILDIRVSNNVIRFLILYCKLYIADLLQDFDLSFYLNFTSRFKSRY